VQVLIREPGLLCVRFASGSSSYQVGVSLRKIIRSLHAGGEDFPHNTGAENLANIKTRSRLVLHVNRITIISMSSTRSDPDRHPFGNRGRADGFVTLLLRHSLRLVVAPTKAKRMLLVVDGHPKLPRSNFNRNLRTLQKFK